MIHYYILVYQQNSNSFEQKNDINFTKLFNNKQRITTETSKKENRKDFLVCNV